MNLFPLSNGGYINLDQVAFFEYADHKYMLHQSLKEASNLDSLPAMTLTEEDSQRLKAYLDTIAQSGK